jgi:hypothetical protein
LCRQFTKQSNYRKKIQFYPDKKDLSCNLITVDNRTNVIEVFDHIIENLDQWDDISIRESSGFKKLLTYFDFVFLLHTFHLIFTHTETVFSIGYPI